MSVQIAITMMAITYCIVVLFFSGSLYRVFRFDKNPLRKLQKYANISPLEIPLQVPSPCGTYKKEAKQKARELICVLYVETDALYNLKTRTQWKKKKTKPPRGWNAWKNAMPTTKNVGTAIRFLGRHGAPGLVGVPLLEWELDGHCSSFRLDSSCGFSTSLENSREI